jgi:hypothetical protein
MAPLSIVFNIFNKTSSTNHFTSEGGDFFRIKIVYFPSKSNVNMLFDQHRKTTNIIIPTL